MFGYIYLTENTVNGRKYVGKHVCDHYDNTYLGSGKILKQAIKRYGRSAFQNTVLHVASSEDELNEAEKRFISEYYDVFGEAMYNLAPGGEGGDVFRYASDADKAAFNRKMTEINIKRCSQEDFKDAISRAMREKYADPSERKKQSVKIREAWSDPDLRAKQSERLSNYYKSHKKDNSYMEQPCSFRLGDRYEEFNSVKSMLQFLKDEFSFTPSRATTKKLFTTGVPYIPYHKGKHDDLSGMVIQKLQQSERVETMGDECNPVGCEIGTHPKRKTEIEEIVHPA